MAFAISAVCATRVEPSTSSSSCANLCTAAGPQRPSRPAFVREFQGASVKFEARVPRTFVHSAPRFQVVCDATPTADELREQIYSGSPIEKIRACNALRDFPDKKTAVDIIEPACTDSNPQLRYLAVSVLADIGDADPERAGKIMLERLQTDGDTTVIATAADGVAFLKVEGAFDYLIEAFQKNSDWVVRLSILAAMGEIDDPRVYDTLVEVVELGDQCEELLRAAAIGALGDIGDKRAIDVLKPLLETTEGQVKERVKMSLQQLGAQV